MLLNPDMLPKVALNQMNSIHDTEVEILNELYRAAKEGNLEEVEKLFEEFLKDVKEHFSYEQGLMEKYNFFAYPMHRGEHDRVLMELENLKKSYEETKDPSLIVKYLENQFVPWLLNHVQTMDTVTAMYLSNYVKE